MTFNVLGWTLNLTQLQLLSDGHESRIFVRVSISGNCQHTSKAIQLVYDHAYFRPKMKKVHI